MEDRHFVQFLETEILYWRPIFYMNRRGERRRIYDETLLAIDRESCYNMVYCVEIVEGKHERFGNVP